MDRLPVCPSSVSSTFCRCRNPTEERTRLGQLPETDVSTPSVALVERRNPKGPSPQFWGRDGIHHDSVSATQHGASVSTDGDGAGGPLIGAAIPKRPQLFLMRVDDALSASVPIESGTPLVQHLLAGSVRCASVEGESLRGCSSCNVMCLVGLVTSLAACLFGLVAKTAVRLRHREVPFEPRGTPIPSSQAPAALSRSKQGILFNPWTAGVGASQGTTVGVSALGPA